MKLTKRTREKLYAAQGKPISITWPQDSPDPHKGKRYPVYGEGGKLFTIRVEGSKRLKYGTKAIVRIDNDPVRLLAGLPGVRNEQGDYVDEPERVSEEYEAQIALEGRAKTIVQGAELRQEAGRQGREQSIPASNRSQRAKERRLRFEKEVA
jgi:hypothetical protein